LNKNLRPLSILHITDSFHPEKGGVERVVENLAVEQAKAGHVVSVMCKQIPGPPRREIYRDVDVFRYRRRERPTPRNYTSSYLGANRSFSRILSERRIDLVHCHLTLSSQGVIGIAKRRNIPLMASFYGPWDLEFLAETRDLLERSNPIYRAYLKTQMAVQRYLQRRLLRHADRLIVLSRHSMIQVGRLWPGTHKKLVQIPGGVECDRFFPGEHKSGLRKNFGFSKESFCILTLRRLVRRMGVDLLIDAVKTCRDKGLDVVLVVGGHGPLRDTLEDQVHAIGLSDAVFFAGLIPESDLADAYREADLFVLPTREEENFGLPILEAAACATPVIGTPVGSIPEVIGMISDDLMTATPTASAIAEKIMWAVKNRVQLEKRFSIIAKRIPARFDWPVIAKSTESIYREGIG
jgi:glycosyltransferase involved in cell wall biosynthesis